VAILLEGAEAPQAHAEQMSVMTKTTSTIRQALDAAHDRLVRSPDEDPTSWAPMYLRARMALEDLDDEIETHDRMDERLASILGLPKTTSIHEIAAQVERLARARSVSSDRMREVYTTVVNWRRQVHLVPAEPRTATMLAVVDAAIAAERVER
jgi:hypothetical protein